MHVMPDTVARIVRGESCRAQKPMMRATATAPLTSRTPTGGPLVFGSIRLLTHCDMPVSWLAAAAGAISSERCRARWRLLLDV